MKNFIKLFSKRKIHPIDTNIIILMDLDQTIIYRKYIESHYNLHLHREITLGDIDSNYKLDYDKVQPKPDLILDNEIIYVRPNTREFLEKLCDKFGEHCIHLFTSGDYNYAQTILQKLDLLKYFNRILAKNFTIDELINNNHFLKKDLNHIRKYLFMKDTDIIYMIDDSPELIIKSEYDIIIPIEPFRPAIKLYNLQVIKDEYQLDPTDKIPNDDSLLKILNIIKN